MTVSSPTTLGQLSTSVGSNVQTYKALPGRNLGSMTLKLCVSLRQFIDMSWVANKTNNEAHANFSGEAVAQRTLIPAHSKGLAQYTLMGLVNAQFRKMKEQGKEVSTEVEELVKQLPSGPYASLQPVTCNIRHIPFGGGNDIQVKSVKDRYDNDTGVFDIVLSQSHLLYVVDGQHRRSGFEQVLDFLRRVNKDYQYPKKGIFVPKNHDFNSLMSERVHDFWQDVLETALVDSTLSVEVHLGLNPDQEQQMFVDLNEKGKKPGVSLVNSFDHADPVNQFIANDLVKGNVINFSLSEDDQSDWHKDTGEMKRKDIKSICSLLFLGKTSSSGATPVVIEERKDFAIKFWEAIGKVPDFGTQGARAKLVLQQPILIQSIAKLAYDLGFGTPQIRNHEHLAALFSAITDGKLDFSHDNKLWRSLFFNKEEREKMLPGVSDYVHVPLSTNLDAGTFDEDNSWVRFGSRHNDIRPRIGDLIRFQLSFNPRPTVTKAIKLELNPEPQL
ncbi:hypothetical protein OAI23_06450 [Alphaproteobacteria bacterium]|nr:hypothetical protein [Alphaproteobacteria bacterium]MDC1121575.1 DNA sulfur modification protein DndB [Alphaproteobacteria bacterium]